MPEAEGERRSSARAWRLARSPSPGPARAIGAHRAGCLQGGEALGPRGPGYRLMGARRLRGFGHPELVDFVRRLGARVHAAGLAPLRVGDLSQARGGPAPPLHASHQTGLDVDIYYAPAGPGRRTRRVASLLRLASADPRVARILINPRIKRALCRSAGADRQWLGKLEPWWGHVRHFHVQLACPAGSDECVGRPPRPPGDGCEELAWWYDRGKLRERQLRRRQIRGWTAAAAILPASCEPLAPQRFDLAGTRRRR